MVNWFVRTYMQSFYQIILFMTRTGLITLLTTVNKGISQLESFALNRLLEEKNKLFNETRLTGSVTITTITTITFEVIKCVEDN